MLEKSANYFNKLFIEKTDSTLLQFIRYGLVSGVSLGVDLGLLILLTEVFHLHYLLSATIGFSFGLITNYLLSTIWVFDKSNFKPTAEFMIFLIIGIVGLGLNNLLLWLFTDKLGLYYIGSKLVAIFATFMWNFVARKTILFSDKKRNLKNE